METDQRRR